MAASGEGLAADISRAADGYVEAKLRLLGEGQERRQAVLFTTGVEAFHLRLDDRYYLHEFDHEPDGQRLVLRALVGVAAAHCRGESVPMKEPRLLRRGRDCLDVTWARETYRARS